MSVMLCSFCCCRIEVPNAHYLKRCAIFPGSVHISCPVLALCCLSQSSLSAGLRLGWSQLEESEQY